MIKYFGMADCKKVKFGRLIGGPLPLPGTALTAFVARLNGYRPLDNVYFWNALVSLSVAYCLILA
jgi:hypothetical protein